MFWKINFVIFFKLCALSLMIRIISLKNLTHLKKIIIFLFLIRLFYTHNLDCKFNEIFYISLALINIFTYLL
jgi:hypothetical protein